MPEPASAGAVEEGPPGTGRQSKEPANEGARNGAFLRGQPPGAENSNEEVSQMENNQYHETNLMTIYISKHFL